MCLFLRGGIARELIQAVVNQQRTATVPIFPSHDTPVEVVADAAPVAAELPRVISDGVNVSNQVPADKLKGANAWAWHLRSLTAARSLVREVERNGQMFVHRAALEFHLTRSQKLVRKSDGRLAVNERLFAP